MILKKRSVTLETRVPKVKLRNLPLQVTGFRKLRLVILETRVQKEKVSHPRLERGDGARQFKVQYRPQILITFKYYIDKR